MEDTIHAKKFQEIPPRDKQPIVPASVELKSQAALT
jgi:hypothetical protein